MSGFSEKEVQAELERRKSASLREEEAKKYRTPPHPSGEHCIHCQTALTALERPPLCDICLGN
ncbi:hypothetical protein LB513_02105 [Mesorhizobium sp. ES1-1]|nr:hypothetical protein [Mesorhizobium sp. ES1-1]